MPFVLIGDSGQRDALTYAEMAREFPGRVHLIIIRQVGEDDDDRNVAVREQAETLRAEGIPFHLVPDAARAAELCQAEGLCDEETLVEVAGESGEV
jgi:phosphatidate phosphatase APP1